MSLIRSRVFSCLIVDIGAGEATAVPHSRVRRRLAKPRKRVECESTSAPPDYGCRTGAVRTSERGYILVEALVAATLVALAFGFIVLLTMPRHS